MLRVFVDQDFDHDILRGLRLHLPNLDAVTALQAGLDRKTGLKFSRGPLNKIESSLHTTATP
ncbi:MAG: hypothetical protein AB1813_13855 [Verrucomicrobiota bacterium]